MIELAFEEFTARRRTAQEELEDALRAAVRRAVDLNQDTNGWQELVHRVTVLYQRTYYEESGQRTTHLPRGVRALLLETLRKTKDRDHNSVERITVWLATLILSQATIQAAIDDEDEVFLEWVTMHDDDVRHTHVGADGQVQPIGDKYTVGGEEMRYPGDPTVSIELWINCRCTLRPVLAAEENRKFTVEFISEKPWSGAASRFTDEQWKASCVLHLDSSLNKSSHKLPIKEPGGALSRAGVHAAAGRIGSVDAPPDKIASAKRALRGAYKQLGEDPPDSLTAGGPMTTDKFTLPDGQTAVVTWVPKTAPITTTSPYGGMTMTTDGSSPFTVTWAPKTAAPPEEPTVEEAPPEDAVEEKDDVLVPWHGVLAPEGVASGDGRMFAPDSLRMRTLPLPLTWQKASGDGHAGSVTVAKIEKIERRDGMLRGSGYFISNPEADEVIGLLGEFGKFGVSVDADDATMEVDEAEEMVIFTSARIASASIVAIPAFAEAYVALGPWDDEDQTEPNEDPVPEPANPDETEETLAASAQTFLDVAPGITEDGPGWLTHPVDTDRLRDYWVRGPGAAKIGWGSPGDFNRCRANVAEYIKPQYLNGYCANRHYDALGFWPGRHASAADSLTDTAPSDAVALVSSVGHIAPAAWFTNPGLTELTPLTVTDEGRVFGHLAGWSTCHIGFKDTCTSPPMSATDYAYFRTGQVALDDGTRVNTGPITLGGGHAGPRLGMGAAIEHYDSTSTVVADVTMGEDDHGIWFSGWVRPGVDADTVTALRASALSGDWRKVGGNLELVAALAVNTPGFPVPRTKVAASSQGQLSLVASGVVTSLPVKPEQSTVSAMAAAVASELRAIDSRRARMVALAQKVGQ